MPIKAILFDKDGTLIDFAATFGPATALVIRDIADGDAEIAARIAEASAFDLKTFSIETNSVLIAGSLENIVTEWKRHLPAARMAETLKRVDKLYEIHSLKTLTPFIVLEPTLDALDALNLPYGIATNDTEATARAHMDALGLASRFAAIIGYNSGYGEKPGPGMVTAFVRQMDVAASDVMMVGDSTHDLIAGKAAGCLTIAVTSGLADAAVLAPHADHVLPDISHLPALVAHLNARVPA